MRDSSNNEVLVEGVKKESNWVGGMRGGKEGYVAEMHDFGNCYNGGKEEKKLQ